MHEPRWQLRHTEHVCRAVLEQGCVAPSEGALGLVQKYLVNVSCPFTKRPFLKQYTLFFVLILGGRQKTPPLIDWLALMFAILVLHGWWGYAKRKQVVFRRPMYQKGKWYTTPYS